MPLRTPAMIAALAALTLGAAACTQAEQNKAEDKTHTAAAETRSAAAQAGEVVESGAMKAAQAVETGAGKVADKLEDNQARAAAQGRPGAVDPATDQRVPAKN